MSNHGPRFDEFHAQSGTPHGGALADSGYRTSTATDLLADGGYRDGIPNTRGRGDATEPRWDDFPWQDMPIIHGAHFDSDFEQPSMLAGVEHGTWQDVFRGGAQVRAIVDGKDVEAVVIDCHADHAKLKLRDGSVAEAALAQLRAFRGPAPERGGIKSADVGHTDAPIVASTAEAPSAHSATASGGHLPQAHKTLDEILDVFKSVDATETALQGDSNSGGSVGHRKGCPRGGNAPCGSDQGGSCSVCKAQVRDHEAMGKTTDDDVDVAKAFHCAGCKAPIKPGAAGTVSVGTIGKSGAKHYCNTCAAQNNMGGGYGDGIGRVLGKTADPMVDVLKSIEDLAS